ncbi:putative MFS family arabinose efflux permease [Kribbella orskensis]|uniref:MFS family arabinose efflux permease n=1 Tax=Kribbella orskensis TaxID=2512216 RepID=A0ABY2BRC3_9ACTN|nr:MULTISPECIES: MFS transporter [Kribbella]TCN43198.1 putative MFS family arabinose efflux permease [Kribbella sp. VKM Ac-2500]TCO29446.1 putative MFS family arabinose efflux permease [Kribbella orskensis]
MKTLTPTSLWRDRQFRTFWSAQGVSEFGDRISELALPLIAVTLLDASPSQVGFLTAAVWLPNLASLFIGTWVDKRRDKRPLMIAADLSRTIVLLSLPAAYWLDLLTLGQLYAVAILAGTAHVLFNTAYASFFVRLVSRDHFLEANSKLSATRSISFMGGPALGGLLVQWLSAPVAIVVDALTFVFSAVQVSRLKTAPAEADESEDSLLRRAREGMRYLLRHPYLRSSLGCATTVNFFNLISTALLVLFASRNLELSAGTIGIAFGIGASGGLLGALAATPLTRLLGAGRLIALGAVVFPASIAIAAFASGPVWVRAGVLAAAEFIGAFAVMCFDVPLNSLQAAVIHEHMRSRVAGAFSSINYGVRPLGAVIGGLLGTWIGVRETLLISATGGLFAVLWLIGSPILTTRSLEDLEPPPLA